uniref:Uncharacterized protein n=1 Tax=Oryza glaberrima TaxID=4538 RepID=I1NVQ8_ORYGL
MVGPTWAPPVNLASLLSSPPLFTSRTPPQRRSTSGADDSLSLGTSATATATENASHHSTSANSGVYLSATSNVTHRRHVVTVRHLRGLGLRTGRGSASGGGAQPEPQAAVGCPGAGGAALGAKDDGDEAAHEDDSPRHYS